MNQDFQYVGSFLVDSTWIAIGDVDTPDSSDRNIQYHCITGTWNVYREDVRNEDGTNNYKLVADGYEDAESDEGLVEEVFLGEPSTIIGTLVSARSSGYDYNAVATRDYSDGCIVSDFGVDFASDAETLFVQAYEIDESAIAISLTV